MTRYEVEWGHCEGCGALGELGEGCCVTCWDDGLPQSRMLLAQERKLQVKILRERGLRPGEIARELSVSLRTVHRR